MDYISREAAISEFETCGAVFVYGKKVCKAIVSRLNVIPAADVVEVVHGRWEPFDLVFGRSIYVCTACERAVKMPTAMGLPTFKYCPNCGAKMIVMHEPDINPCRGCDDYDGIGECVSDGGCAGMDGDIDDTR